MSKVIPPEYYICDYCGKKQDHYSDFKYMDNFGLDAKTYDMCSDQCYEKHLDYLKTIFQDKNMIKKYDLQNYSIEMWIKDWITNRGDKL